MLTQKKLFLFIQVKTRFKKFLRSLYQHMLEEHGSADQHSASTSGPSEPEQPVIAGLADDGVQNVPVHALIVSHGAFIRVSVRHLVEDLQCCLPAGLKMNQIFSPCPNTGISRFIITLRREESGLRASRIQCVFINRKDHLDDVKLWLTVMRCIWDCFGLSEMASVCIYCSLQTQQLKHMQVWVVDFV